MPTTIATPDRFDVLGVPISVVTPQTALDALMGWSADDVGRLVCIRDVHGIMRAREDPELRKIHNEAAMVTPDGMPVVWIGKIRGRPVERTCGPDLMAAAMELPLDRSLKHYLYGGKEGVARELSERMIKRTPWLKIVGLETPPFRELGGEEIAKLAERINATGADVVWIGLSTPKQERLMWYLRPLVGSTLVGVGAAFDIHAGHTRRAPRWMQVLALESVYRLVNEPRRLWRRYLLLAPQFMVLALRQEARRLLRKHVGI